MQLIAYYSLHYPCVGDGVDAGLILTRMLQTDISEDFSIYVYYVQLKVTNIEIAYTRSQA